MRAIEQSAEHHFVATLADIKDKPNNWMVLYLELSRNFSFENGLKDVIITKVSMHFEINLKLW